MQTQEHKVSEFLDAVAAKSPTPGGGAVASFTAALGAALAQMVLRYSQGKKALSEHASLHDEALAELAAAAARFQELAQEDAQAYGNLNTLWKLDKADPMRIQQWSAAVHAAIQPPREIVSLSLKMLQRMKQLTGKTNAMLDSDLAIAAILAEAAARAGAWNVRINQPLMENVDEASQLQDQMQRELQQCRELCEQIDQACAASLNG